MNQNNPLISTYKKSHDISHDSLLGTILTFPNFLCHLKIGIIKESSVKPLSKVVIIQFQNADENLNLCGIKTIKKSLATEVTRPFIKTFFYWQNRAEEKQPICSMKYI